MRTPAACSSLVSATPCTRALVGEKKKFKSGYAHANIDGFNKVVYFGIFDDEIYAAIAQGAYVRTMPPAARPRLVNFLSFVEQTKLKLPRPFLVQILRKTNRSGLQWEKATITGCRTDNSDHAQEYSACLL